MNSAGLQEEGARLPCRRAEVSALSRISLVAVSCLWFNGGVQRTRVDSVIAWPVVFRGGYRAVVLAAIAIAALCGPPGIAAAAGVPPSPEDIAGQYEMGSGPNRVALTLFDGGTFVMDSRSDMGGVRQLRGQWNLYHTQLVLRTIDGARRFRWVIAIFPRVDGFDLVPEETLEPYKQSPTDTGSRYRRVGNVPAAPIERKVVPSADPLPSPRISRPAASPPSTTEVATSSELARKPHAVVRPAALRIAKPRDLAIFTYMPAPAEPPDMRRLTGPGLARVSISERGKVSSVTVLQSTGNPAFDADAVATLRQWRTEAGAAREIELPLTTVMSGKRRPVRVPTSAGTMTSG